MTPLERARNKFNISQQELARMSGIAQSTISDIESRQTPNPRVDTLRLLSKAMKIPLIELFDEEDAS